jgi:purine nucleoside phosphorylase
MRICALSCVAIFAAGITGDALTEEEVLDSMKQVSSRLGSLLRSILEAL